MKLEQIFFVKETVSFILRKQDILLKEVLSFIMKKQDNFLKEVVSFMKTGNFIKIRVLLVLTSHNVPYVIFIDIKKSGFIK